MSIEWVWGLTILNLLILLLGILYFTIWAKKRKE